MAFIITHGDLSFLLYLAVAEGSRGMGYGTRVLDEVKRMSAGRRLFLNIEPLDEDSDNMAQRMSRKRFYERNGFREGFVIVTSDGIRYQMMLYDCDMTPQEMAELSSHLVDVGVFGPSDI